MDTIEKISNKIPILRLLLFILYKIISLIYLKIKDDKTIESLTIEIKNLSLNTTYTTSYVNPQFNDYSAIVYYLKVNNVQNISYIAGYDTRFIFLDNTKKNVEINKLIKLSSIYENDGININCSISLSSTNVKIIKSFINECVKNYNKYLLHKKNKNKCIEDKSIESLTINIPALSSDATVETAKENPRFKEYLAIVYYLKCKHIQNVNYVADITGKFIFLNNVKNVKINNLITFTSFFIDDGCKIFLNLELSSINVKIIREFIDKCLVDFDKYIENKEDYNFCDKTVKV